MTSDGPGPRVPSEVLAGAELDILNAFMDLQLLERYGQVYAAAQLGHVAHGSDEWDRILTLLQDVRPAAVDTLLGHFLVAWNELARGSCPVKWCTTATVATVLPAVNSRGVRPSSPPAAG